MPQLDRLGLKENPFNNATAQRFFYADQSRAQIMESTEHLIEFSNNLQVIIGAHGVGKSHFLEALEAKRDNNWRIVKITDSAQFDTLSLIQNIMNSFGANTDGGMELLESLENQLSEILQLGSKPVLLIDNAHTLSAESLRFLMQLSQQEQDDEPYIHIVLFATSVITEYLQSPDFKEFRDTVHIAILNNFDKEGVSGYLRHKLAVAGFDRESPFTPRIIDSIYNDSAGIPEKINFFAEKFLNSSGKAENYIETPLSQNDDSISTAKANSSTDDPFNIENNSFESVNENIESSITSHKMSSDEQFDIFADANIDEIKQDPMDDQLSRLTEQFDEIENMGNELPIEESGPGSFFNPELIDDEVQINQQSSTSNADKNSNKRSDRNLAKFIIPIATIATVLISVFAIKSLFNQTDSPPQTIKQVELLPLELPPEGTFEIVENTVDTAPIEANDAQVTTEQALEKNIKSITTASEAEQIVNTEQAELIDTIVKDQPDNNEQAEIQIEEIQAKVNSPENIKTDTIELVEVQTAELEIAEPETTKSDDNNQQTINIEKPQINSIEPTPIIGSSKRQTISIKGQGFSPDMSLIVFFDKNKKEFSKLATPNQWQYIDNKAIKLHLSTGTNNQKWSMLAQTKNAIASNKISFDIIRPYTSSAISKIERLSPNPMQGSNQRQTLSISGQRFNSDSIIQLQWENNKKQFSRRQSPSQFEFISANKIKLFITTGKEERQWHVSLMGKQASLKTMAFNVINQNSNKKSINNLNKESIKNTSSLHGHQWLLQQADENFTLQLFASRDKNAITNLIKRYSLKGDIARFETQRDGTLWYSMTYGQYQSKEAANSAISTLDPKLQSPKPWIRNFSSIKNQLKDKTSPSLNNTLMIDKANGIKDDAWIWTQNPSNYALQLVSLSSSQAIKDYARQQNIESQSAFFTSTSNGRKLYTLLYGSYSSKEAAEQAKTSLALKIKSSKPWVRKISDIHAVMGE